MLFSSLQAFDGHQHAHKSCYCLMAYIRSVVHPTRHLGGADYLRHFTSACGDPLEVEPTGLDRSNLLLDSVNSFVLRISNLQRHSGQSESHRKFARLNRISHQFNVAVSAITIDPVYPFWAFQLLHYFPMETRVSITQPNLSCQFFL